MMRIRPEIKKSRMPEVERICPACNRKFTIPIAATGDPGLDGALVSLGEHLRTRCPACREQKAKNAEKAREHWLPYKD